MAKNPVKVVLIEYHHIQTDVSNFKSVVQRLTGMDSAAVDGGGESRKRRRVDESTVISVKERIEESRESYKTSTTSFDEQSASFKDLDRFLKLELPFMEDLDWIWSD